MKTTLVGLLDQVVSVYDKTKTFIAGRVAQKVVDGISVLGAPLSKWADVFTLTGVAPGFCVANPDTGRKFEIQNVNTNTPTVLAFNWNKDDGEWTFIGKVILTLPPGTHTFRSFKFDDTNTSNIILMLSSSVATTTCNSGQYITWGVPLTDFTIGGTTITLASSPTAGSKGVYFVQYSSELGRAHTGITPGGTGSGIAAVTPANKTKYWMQNGASASLQIYGWDYSLGAPAVSGLVNSGVNSSTTAFAGTSPSAYFSMSAQNGYSTLANTAAAFEAIILQNGSGSVPANFTSTTAGGAQTQYFLRDLQLVSGTWYFNLATTSTGAAVVPTSTTSNFTMMRANGISNTHSLLKTAIVTPALTGTLLVTHSFGVKRPLSVPANVTLNNVDCLSIATSSTVYLGPISELVDGSASWPNLTGVNLLGTGVDFVAPVAIFADYIPTLDRWVIVSNGSKFYVKPHQNNIIDAALGGLVTSYYEAQNPITVQPGLSTVLSISTADGWLFIVGSATGQRGVCSVDLKSDQQFDYSYIISKICQVEPGSKLFSPSTVEAIYEETDNCDFYVRSANSASDAIFNSPTGGWTQIFVGQDNSSIALGPYFQILVKYNILTDGSGTPAQINDIALTYKSQTEISGKWLYSKNQSSDSSSVFYLKTPYATSVPKLYARYFDLSDTLAFEKNTTDHAASFKYSTDNGVTWTAIGTIPNTAGTLVKIDYSPVPTFNIIPVLSES